MPTNFKYGLLTLFLFLSAFRGSADTLTLIPVNPSSVRYDLGPHFSGWKDGAGTATPFEALDQAEWFRAVNKLTYEDPTQVYWLKLHLHLEGLSEEPWIGN